MPQNTKNKMTTLKFLITYKFMYLMTEAKIQILMAKNRKRCQKEIKPLTVYMQEFFLF